MFDWIRNRVKNSVLAGFNDAFEKLNAGRNAVPEIVDAEARFDTYLALPAPETTTPPGRRNRNRAE